MSDAHETSHCAQPAFPEDGGDLAVRSTVHGWMLTRAE